MPKKTPRNPRTERLQLTLFIHKETEKGLLLSPDADEDNAEWFPKSQVTLGDKIRRRPHISLDRYEFRIPRWLVVDKGFEEFVDAGTSPDDPEELVL